MVESKNIQRGGRMSKNQCNRCRSISIPNARLIQMLAVFVQASKFFLLLGLLGLHVAADVTNAVECQTGC